MYNEYDKTVKVIVTYFGDRRKFPCSEPEQISLISNIFETDVNRDSGIYMDVILVVKVKDYNTVGTNNLSKNVRELLVAIDNKKIYNGIWKVVYVDDLFGTASYSGFSKAFDKYQDSYDYWIFLEDDQIIGVNPNVSSTDNLYMRRLIEEFNDNISNNINIGYLAIKNITETGWRGGEEIIQPNKNLKKISHISPYSMAAVPHVNNGSGFSSTIVLKQIRDEFGYLPYAYCKKEDLNIVHTCWGDIKEEEYANKSYYRVAAKYSEMDFTRCYVDMGYELIQSKNRILITGLNS